MPEQKNIDAAAGETIGILEDTSKGNVIFVRGWDGVGASAAFKAVAQRLKSSKSKFDRVIHVDCSLWKSMRSLQKAIAEEVELPPSVMAILDRWDEEDDFSGIVEGYRGVIPDIRTEIFRKLASSIFVVIFHNGSDKYIDLYECGVLWTWHGRFQSKYINFKERERMELHTDVVVNYSHDDCISLLEEAKEVVTYMGIPEPYMNHMIVDKCFQYTYALGSVSWFSWGYWENHVFNYFVCDGIIQGQGDRSAWGVADALRRNMSVELRFHTNDDKGLVPDEIGMDLSEVTSCFILPKDYVDYQIATLPDGIFQHSHSSKLHALHLSCCGFSFQSPPFLNITSNKHPSHNEDISCFQKLWVLHLCCTNWYRLLSEEMMNFMADLRELTVEEEQGYYLTTKDHNLPHLSSASFLKTVILINCCPRMLPPSLESFTFSRDSYTHDYAGISRISFRGCSQLESILLQGDLEKLEELDLSGTAVKALDLRELEINNIKFLILLGCEKLYAILWPPENKRTKVLQHQDQNYPVLTQYGQANLEEKPSDPIAAVGSSSVHVATATELGISRHASFEFQWYISPRDKRILSSATVGDSEAAQGIRSLRKPNNYLYATGTDNDEGVISWMWDCPAIPTPTAQDLYVHLQDNQGMKRGLLQQQQSNIEGINISADSPSRFVFNNARMLHVHDSSSITCPQGSYWRSLEWCRVERCPKLRTIFRTAQQSEGDSFCHQLSTFWASQLLKARYIWYWSAMRVFSSVNIVLLHLDYCPRLIHVLPLSESVDTLPCLDILEILCCGDLREVFALDPKQKEQKVIQFPKLRCIHLYELPSLRCICGGRMSAPNLKTVKIRGCWNLRCLPAVSGNKEKLPSVDCEKEWWDNLEWDGVEANHHSSLYEHSHSSYYKAQLPRGTVLR
ncbi:hypothetical protein VPH35_108297 [Triticum aestivum]